jgi:hypothetical protein
MKYALGDKYIDHNGEVFVVTKFRNGPALVNVRNGESLCSIGGPETMGYKKITNLATWNRLVLTATLMTA